jgi:hypothetical protein
MDELSAWLSGDGFSFRHFPMIVFHLHFADELCLILVCIAIPPKVEDAFKSFKYVPYSALTHAACARAAEGEEDFVINSQGGLSAKPLDGKDKKSISIVDWLSAAATAEDRTCFHHGDARADALGAHHKFVQELARLHGWHIAVEYDVLQRFLTVQNPRHDLGTLDPDAVSLIVSRMLVQQLNKNFPSASFMLIIPEVLFSWGKCFCSVTL